MLLTSHTMRIVRGSQALLSHFCDVSGRKTLVYVIGSLRWRWRPTKRLWPCCEICAIPDAAAARWVPSLPSDAFRTMRRKSGVGTGSVILLKCMVSVFYLLFPTNWTAMITYNCCMEPRWVEWWGAVVESCRVPPTSRASSWNGSWRRNDRHWASSRHSQRQPGLFAW